MRLRCCAWGAAMLRVLQRPATCVKISAAIYLVVSTAIIIFGRNVPAIWQGMIGLIASLEGFYGAEASDPRRVAFFLIILFPSVAVSCALGTLAVTGSDILVNCNAAPVTVWSSNTTTTVKSSASFEQCNTSFKVYGFVELLGGAAIGLVIIVAVAISLRRIRQEAAELNAKQTDLELLTAA